MPRKQTSDLEIDVARIEEREKANAEWKDKVDKELEGINKQLANLPDVLIAKLDERYAKKSELLEIKETVDPLTNLRKRIWYFMIAVFVAEAFALMVMTSNIKEWLK